MKKTILIVYLSVLAMIASAQNVYITADIDYGCSPLTVNFTNETHQNLDTTNVMFYWSYDDGSDMETTYHSSHSFAEPGYYSVYVYGDSLGKYIGGYNLEIIVNGISGNFYPEDGSAFCPGEWIEFSVMEESNWVEWNFGEGGEPNTNQWTQYQFQSEGVHTVQLVINHNCGQDTLTQTIDLTNAAIPEPHVSASNEQVCKNDELRFSTNSRAESYLWDFGSGNTSVIPEPVYAFPDTGKHWVSLEVSNSCGNSAKDSILISVDTGLYVYAGFNEPESTCPNSMIHFYAWSSGNYQWDFGNGVTGTNMEEMVSYQNVGEYEVQLIVSNGCGNSDTATNIINIDYDPSYIPEVYMSMHDNNYNYFDTMYVCPGSNLFFENNSYFDDTQFAWYFGDGDTLFSSEREIEHQFHILGNYTVLLVGRNGCGGVDTARKWVFVTDNLMPESDLTNLPLAICPGEYVYFFDENSNDSYKYSIWFGDGYNVQNVGPENDSVVPVTARHQYHNSGMYQYTFAVTNTCGNTLSKVDTIYVSDTLGKSFIMAWNDTEDDPERMACPGDTIEFYGVGGVSVVWDFGNGVYDTNIIGHHAYDEVGTHTANAIFTSGCGMIDTAEVMAYVGSNNLPYDGFSVYSKGNSNCSNDTTYFDYHGWDEDRNLRFKWFFGDGDSSLVSNPVHVYDTSGEYSVELWVSNGCGTSHSSQQIFVNGIFINDNAIALTDPDCGVENGMIGGISAFGGGLNTIQWLNANYDVVGTSLSVSNLSAGNYMLKLSTIDGCKAMSEPYSLSNTGAPAPPDAESPMPYCMGDEMNDLVASANSGGVLIWYGDPALTDSLDTGTNFNPNVEHTSDFYVTETSGNCESSPTRVTVMYNKTYSIQDTLRLCFGDTYYINGEHQTEPGTYVDTLTSFMGCDSIRSATIYFKPVAHNQIFVSVCEGDNYYVQGAWQSEAGMYYDTLIAANGCDSIVETHLSLKKSYMMEYDTYICSGDSVYLEGEWQKSSGTYADMYATILGCDSVVVINLIVGDEYINSTYTTICKGDSIFFKDMWLKESGVYNDTLVSGTSCDSINQLVLTVPDRYSISVDETICKGDSVFLEGGWQSNGGMYYDTLQSDAGCDSVVVTSLIVEQHMQYGSKTATICQGDSLFIGAMWRKTSGTYADTIAGPLCDSIFNVVLTVTSAPVNNLSETICEGDSVMFDTRWIKTAGTYTETYAAVDGCDSVVTLIVTVTDCQSGLNDLLSDGWDIFPNPSSGIFTIRIDEIVNEKLLIFDVTGKLVYKTTVNNHVMSIDLSNSDKGVYFIHYNKLRKQIIIE